PALLEGFHGGAMRLPVEFRHPLLDLRLLRFSLRIPANPWTWDKHVAREAARGLLPEAIRTRPKEPLARDVYTDLLRQPGMIPPSLTVAADGLAAYIDVQVWRDSLSQPHELRSSEDLFPLAFNGWLHAGWQVPPSSPADPSDVPPALSPCSTVAPT
ncbi:MAG TPA: asparagine synthase-related protein, partial [Longimicrobiaceae bacterium]